MHPTRKESPYKISLDFNVPNTVTASRVVLTLFIIYFMLQSQYTLAGILIIVAAITDGVDGFLSRRLGQSSLGGALFDMIADQLFFMSTLTLAITAGLFVNADGLVPLNPYLYAVPAFAGGVAVILGIIIYLWKRRKRTFPFPAPTRVAKVNFWFWLAPLIIAILGIGPGWLLAGLMYLAIISTLLTFYSYLRKAGYVFTN